MRDAQPSTIFLTDYQPPAFFIDETHLNFELYEDHARVEARLCMRRNPDAAADAVLVLHGQALELLELAVDARVLDTTDYQQTTDQLSITAPLPGRFELSCVTRILPQDNTSLEGLYKSRTMFCTQCEAEGFRKITYYLDRPDVMSVFSVRLEAERQRYPVLLSNGNLQEQGDCEDRHWALWHDPFPKPSYLFALVAGDLDCVQDKFITGSGREVSLRIFVESKDLDKCGHAMRSLQNSMRWDEEKFGREYDLELFNIVAVDDFNMGAMENKSLNIFNTSCVLAHPQTTTDAGFQRVEAVVAHEYFHNWSGNRVTCRDWFQLSLKEGFTVYRDAEFSADMGSRTVKRIEDVAMLRTVQFAEDGGPMAHPVRPDSFIEISNFYTATVYEKGAEVVRMLRTLLGAGDFRRGTDLYFQRHDGQAVTCDDFVKAMEDASGRDLRQFRLWYSQAGTPKLTIHSSWDADNGHYTLHVRQSCPATPGQPEKAPFLIPLEVGLLGEAGALRLQPDAEAPDPETADNTSLVLEITADEQAFSFSNLPERPVPSLLRGFSAPVKLDYPYTRAELAFLVSRDDDGFARWDAAQQLAVDVIGEVQAGAADVDRVLLAAFGEVLADASVDPAMVAEILRLPSENYLAELSEKADVEGIHRARDTVRRAIAGHLAGPLLERYQALEQPLEYAAKAEQIAQRALRNTCLAYLAFADAGAGVALATKQFFEASNMTDRQAALLAVVNNGSEAQREQVLDRFYQDWQQEPLVVNMWLQAQATCSQPGNIKRVRKLMSHPAFEMKNPNRVRSLIGAFCSANPINFHCEDGSGYQLLGEVVSELNSLNPQIASRLLTPLTKWRRYSGREELMRQRLQQLASLPDLSSDVYEVVTKSLQQ